MPDISSDLHIIIYSLLGPIIIILTAPLYAGLVAKFRAKIERRNGPSIFQPYYDLKKLLCKEVIIPEQSSFIFKIFPYLSLITFIMIPFIIPVITSVSIFSYFSDLIVIFSIFLLGAFFTVLCSVDAGTAFGGLGASRESFLISLLEPVILLIILALSIEVGTSNLFAMVRENLHGFEFVAHPSSFFVAIAFLIVILTESKRFPVDNPSTHLELTMVHEALLLEFSGKYLAMLEYASMIKFTVLSSLFFSLFFSFGIAQDFSITGLVFSMILWSIKMVTMAFVIAVYEKSTAKLRLFRVPELLSFALVLSLIAIFTHFYLRAL